MRKGILALLALIAIGCSAACDLCLKIKENEDLSTIIYNVTKGRICYYIENYTVCCWKKGTFLITDNKSIIAVESAAYFEKEFLVPAYLEYNGSFSCTEELEKKLYKKYNLFECREEDAYIETDGGAIIVHPNGKITVLQVYDYNKIVNALKSLEQDLGIDIKNATIPVTLRKVYIVEVSADDCNTLKDELIRLLANYGISNITIEENCTVISPEKLAALSCIPKKEVKKAEARAPPTLNITGRIAGRQVKKGVIKRIVEVLRRWLKNILRNLWLV